MDHNTRKTTEIDNIRYFGRSSNFFPDIDIQCPTPSVICCPTDEMKQI